MFNRSQQYDGNSREQSTRARQAAEALFAPKPQRVEPSVREIAPGGEAVRKPRVLAVAAATPVPRDAPEAPARVELPKKPVIPTAHIARIRAWLNIISDGVAGSENVLVKTLEITGDVGMAVDFLNSGNTTLQDYAKSWAQRHGFKITTEQVRSNPHSSWGSSW